MELPFQEQLPAFDPEGGRKVNQIFGSDNNFVFVAQLLYFTYW